MRARCWSVAVIPSDLSTVPPPLWLVLSTERWKPTATSHCRDHVMLALLHPALAALHPLTSQWPAQVCQDLLAALFILRWESERVADVLMIPFLSCESCKAVNGAQQRGNH